jgi:hypothetical protein
VGRVFLRICAGNSGNRLSYDPYLLIMSGMTKHTRLPLVTALAVCALLCTPESSCVHRRFLRREKTLPPLIKRGNDFLSGL